MVAAATVAGGVHNELGLDGTAGTPLIEGGE